VKGLVVPVALVLVAELCARLFGVESDSLAAPSQILAAAVGIVADGSLFAMTGQTLFAAVAGLLIGGGLGLVTAILLGLVQPLARLMHFSVEAFRPIPAIAILPIMLMIYGFGYRMEIAIIAFACFWPVLIIGQAAVAGIEPRLIEVSKVLGLTFLGRVTKIVLPAALPRLFVAFRLAAAVSLIVAVTVEIAMNPQGLGYELMAAQSSLRPEVMFAILLWVGLIGWGLNAFLLYAQNRLFGFAGKLEAPP
jgi:ABC-type nitrate/sulfonate/bicarbonate transport system permease component